VRYHGICVNDALRLLTEPILTVGWTALQLKAHGAQICPPGKLYRKKTLLHFLLKFFGL